MDLKDIKAIIDLMKKNAISEFELERQDFKIRLKRGVIGPVAVSYEEASTLLASGTVSVLPAPSPSQSAVRAVEAPALAVDIKSPMIGTFYRSPSPESGNYIEVGSEVGPDTVVCIIEAMKVMNEIKAEVRGFISQILVDNARPVEFGQPLFRVRPT